MKTPALLFATALVLAPATAFAHVVVSPTTGAPGGIVNAEFKAGHGCGDLKTTAIRVEIPAAIAMVHAHEIPGWTVKADKAGTKTTAVTWTALKGADTTKPVSAHLQLPDAAAKLYFPATQTCGKTVVKWDEQPGGKAVDKHPAPSIDVGGAPAPAGAAHEEHKH